MINTRQICIIIIIMFNFITVPPLIQQGPFKEREPYGAPLVDMFSPQGFSEREMNQNTGLVTLKRSTSPQIGILGANTFSQDGSMIRKKDSQPSNTVNKTIKAIEVSDRRLLVDDDDVVRNKWCSAMR